MRLISMTEASDQIYNKSINMIKALILETFRDDDVKIMLFGSRARGDFNRHSDIDIGIIPKNKCDRMKLISVKDKFEEMNIPYRVDVVDISRVSNIFRKKVMEEGKIWKN